MISLKNGSLRWILLSHSVLSAARLGFHQNAGTIGDQRVYGGLAELILVDQLDGGAEQPIHLVTEPDVCFAVAAVDAERPHEVGERFPQDQLAAPRPHRFGAHPGQDQARAGCR